MRVLALESATAQVGVALSGDTGPLAAVHLAEGRRHGEVMTPAVEVVCRFAGITLADVDLVAVDVGPGLFTGLRVGVATAQALASALGVPALGVTSTEVLAWAHPHAGRLVAAVVDIRRHEVAWALYRPAGTGAGTPRAAGGPMAGDMVEVRPPQVASPLDLALTLVELEAEVLAVGDGALRYAEELCAPMVTVAGAASAHPSAAVLAELARARRQSAGDPKGLEPHYLRDADVRIGWDRAVLRG